MLNIYDVLILVLYLKSQNDMQEEKFEIRSWKVHQDVETTFSGIEILRNFCKN